MTNSDKKLALNVALIAAAGIFILRPILVKLGLAKSAAEKAAEQATNTAFIENVNQYSNEKQTKSTGEWQLIADQIYADLRYSALDDNKDDAVYQICRVKNNIDLAILNKCFGKRQEYIFGIPSGDLQTLQMFVNSNLSKSQKNTINGNLQRKNIKYQF